MDAPELDENKQTDDIYAEIERVHAALDLFHQDNEDEFVHDLQWLLKKHMRRSDLSPVLAGIHFLMAAHAFGFSGPMAVIMQTLCVDFLGLEDD